MAEQPAVEGDGVTPPTPDATEGAVETDVSSWEELNQGRFDEDGNLTVTVIDDPAIEEEKPAEESPQSEGEEEVSKEPPEAKAEPSVTSDKTQNVLSQLSELTKDLSHEEAVKVFSEWAPSKEHGLLKRVDQLTAKSYSLEDRLRQKSDYIKNLTNEDPLRGQDSDSLAHVKDVEQLKTEFQGMESLRKEAQEAVFKLERPEDVTKFRGEERNKADLQSVVAKAEELLAHGGPFDAKINEFQQAESAKTQRGDLESQLSEHYTWMQNKESAEMKYLSNVVSDPAIAKALESTPALLSELAMSVNARSQFDKSQQIAPKGQTTPPKRSSVSGTSPGDSGLPAGAKHTDQQWTEELKKWSETGDNRDVEKLVGDLEFPSD